VVCWYITLVRSNESLPTEPVHNKSSSCYLKECVGPWRHLMMREVLIHSVIVGQISVDIWLHWYSFKLFVHFLWTLGIISTKECANVRQTSRYLLLFCLLPQSMLFYCLTQFISLLRHLNLDCPLGLLCFTCNSVSIKLISLLLTCPNHYSIFIPNSLKHPTPVSFLIILFLILYIFFILCLKNVIHSIHLYCCSFIAMFQHHA